MMKKSPSSTTAQPKKKEKLTLKDFTRSHNNGELENYFLLSCVLYICMYTQPTQIILQINNCVSTYKHYDNRTLILKLMLLEIVL